jgi:hypothetical protein
MAVWHKGNCVELRLQSALGDSQSGIWLKGESFEVVARKATRSLREEVYKILTNLKNRGEG